MEILEVNEIPKATKPCRSLLMVNRKKFKNIRMCHTKRGNQKRGMWNLAQTIKYIAFVKENFQLFGSEEARRESKIFCMMAKEVKTRTSIQCRSHHQKMVQTYGELSDIISHYEQNVIPYYSSKATPSQPKSSEEVPPEPLYTFKMIGSVLRIQIREQCISSY